VIGVAPSSGRRMRRLARNISGATAVEFAVVAPVLFLMIMGLFDVAHTQYTNSLVHGEMQRAARQLTLENANSRMQVVDAKVRAQIRQIVPKSATIEFEKLSHFDFSDIAEPEEVIGGNNDRVCDPGETYLDDNDNGRWDADRGKDGIGGARDAVLYTAIITYPRMFPISGMIGVPKDVRLEVSTVLRNQPYDEQDRSATSRTC
jgi:Flp pilus assembly pilin Flp